jgi:uncharacterized protein YqhQ
MSDLIEMVLSNTLYIIITACILGVMVYFGMKKMTKLFIFALIALVAFLSYVYYTGESVEDTVEKAGEIVK